MWSRMCLLLGSAALMMSGAAATPALSSERQFTEHLNRAQLEHRASRPHHRVVWVRRWIWDDFWGDYHIVWVPRVTTYRTVSYTPHHRTHIATISDGSGDKAPAETKEAQNKKSDKTDKSAKSDNESKTASADSHSTSAPATAKPDKDTTTASVEPMARPQPPASAEKNTKLASIDTHAKPAETAEKPAAKVNVDLSKPVTPAEIRSAVPVGKLSDPKQTLASAPIKSVWGDTIGKVRGVDLNGGNLKTVDADLGGKSVVKMNPAHLKYVKSRGLLITTLSKDDAAKLPKANTL